MRLFVTGPTGYLGNALIPELLQRGHAVRALVREGSQRKLPRGAEAVIGNALDAKTFAHAIAPCDTFVQLVGVPHPSPSKAEQFRKVDLVSIRQSVEAVRGTSITHFVYLSVAHPAPIMRDYIAVRTEGERLVRDAGIPATFVRPWYVLGPGHWWPYLILPLYWLWPGETSRRLYPVTLAQIVRAMIDAIEHPPLGVRVIEGPEMRGAAIPARPAASSAHARLPR